MSGRGRAWGLVGLAAVLALGACSSSGPGFFQRLGTTVGATLARPDAPPPRERSREELNEIPYATIGVRAPGRQRAILVALVENGDYIDYRDGADRSIRMLGGAVAATEGLFYDLQAVRYDARDPVAHPTPLADWPDQVYRAYEYNIREAPGFIVTLSCSYQPVARETIEIIEISFDLMRVSETCANQRRRLTNTYWVEEETGFIWKSEQWISPDLGQFTVEIIRPHAG